MSPVRYAAHHVRDAHLYSGWLLGGWLHGCVANSRLSISVFHSAVVHDPGLAGGRAFPLRAVLTIPEVLLILHAQRH